MHKVNLRAWYLSQGSAVFKANNTQWKNYEE